MKVNVIQWLGNQNDPEMTIKCREINIVSSGTFQLLPLSVSTNSSKIYSLTVYLCPYTTLYCISYY